MGYYNFSLSRVEIDRFLLDTIKFEDFLENYIETRNGEKLVVFAAEFICRSCWLGCSFSTF